MGSTSCFRRAPVRTPNVVANEHGDLQMAKLSNVIRVPAYHPIDVLVGVQDEILMRQQHLGSA